MDDPEKVNKPLMPTAACRNPHQCLARREIVFRQDAIWVRDHECISCIIGTARRMDSFKPEPDSHPAQWRGGSGRRCGECGERIDHRNKGGMCKACRSAIYGDNL